MQELMNTEFKPSEPEFQDDDDDSKDSDYYEQLAAELDRRTAEEVNNGPNSGQNDPIQEDVPMNMADGPDCADGPDFGGGAENDDAPNTTVCSQFKEYVASKQNNTIRFSKDEACAIRLMDLMWKKKTPLNAYNPLLTWHFRERGYIRDHQTATDSEHYISRDKMLKTLKSRYNIANKMPFEKKIILPVSGTVAKITLHNTEGVLQRLLSNPRIEEDDYLFFDDDPTKGPPEDLLHVGDLITGKAFTDTYHKLINKDETGEQLLGIPMYIDGAAVSQFHHMEIIAVRVSLSIFTREARLKEHMWATIGYIETVGQTGSREEKIKSQTNHESFQDQEAENPDHDRRDAESIPGIGDQPIQDWHAMMKVILEGVVKLQSGGLKWDLPHKGKVHQMHCKIFVPFIKCDNKEADYIAGRYGDYTKCKQICRCCHILTEECDDHLHKMKYKTVREIQKLTQRGDKKRLKAISYHYLTNAFHDLRFSLGNDRGVHGSCPSEMLHQLLLGVFSYLREIFYERMGPKSEVARDMDGLSKLYCNLFRHQSDRTMPKMSFSNGLRTGHLMAKEFRGILLVMLCCLRSKMGRTILQKKKHFNKVTSLDDWILLVETMLQWEAYLNETQMTKKHLQRLKRKNRYIMWLTRKIAPRSAGRGLKLIKFHAILHAVEDVLQFGIPTEFDTSANESHHKESKQAAKLTQRSGSTFTFQTATRLVEHHTVQLAMCELETGRVPWDYYSPLVDISEDEAMDSASAASIVETGGTRISVAMGGNGRPGFQIHSRSKFRDTTRWSPHIVNYLLRLQDEIRTMLPNYSLSVFTYHKRGDQIFRGHPNFRGKGGWRDWAWMDWGREAGGVFPCEIWCFVELKGMPSRRKNGMRAINFDDTRLDDGVYAVVEYANLEKCEVENTRSEIIQRCTKDVELNGTGTVIGRKFWLGDTEAIVNPCAAVADIGGPPNQFFIVAPRTKWVEMFVDWLGKPHTHDEMCIIGEDEEEEEEEEQSESSEDEGDSPGTNSSENSGEMESSSEEEEED